MRKSIPHVERVLREEGRPMRVAEMRERDSTLNSIHNNIVYRDIALDIRDNPSTKLVRLKLGLFGLKEWEREEIRVAEEGQL